ncbi:hypothetical protein CPB83DRAFT_896219 [Crepidotus variabilis]|uniref:Uncharacterized protein n=1 Tax=Crepidotus variabilis TaxID=179855 RepID=A0A9P6EC50_9AGAR|nr:hypothetical protein CPB83DRAFT_896219 [Crepidotus variabilis]
MAESPLWVVVDDTSQEIQYQGNSWFADIGSQDAAGPFGPPYRSTLHGTKSSASLSFSFSTAVTVAGTMLLKDTGNGLDPKWECFIDGKSIGSNPTLGTWPENNKNICGPTDSIPDGQHTLTVNATSQTGQTFWFDNIQYIPSPNASRDNALVMLNPTYPEFKYGPAWTDLAGLPMKATSQAGSKFEYDFEGVSLEWFGAFPKDLPGTSATATYSVDGQTPVTFNLQGHPSDATSNIYHIKFFETPKYPNGNHHLTVVHNGDSTTTPLILYYLVVQNGTSLKTTSTSSNSKPSSTEFGSTPQAPLATTSNSTDTVVHKTSTGAIAGGVIGGVLFLGCIFALILLCLRRRKPQTSEIRASNMAQDASYRVQPFTHQYGATISENSATNLTSPTSAWVANVASRNHSATNSTNVYTSNPVPFPYGSSSSGASPERQPGGYHVSNPSFGSINSASSPGFGISSKHLTIPAPVPLVSPVGPPMSQKGREIAAAETLAQAGRVGANSSQIRRPGESSELPPDYSI